MNNQSNNTQLVPIQQPQRDHVPSNDSNNNEILLSSYDGGSDESVKRSHNASNPRLLEIAYLGPKIVNQWCIQGRCRVKTPKHSFDKPRGRGRCFSFILADQSGEIKITAFNLELDRFYPIVKPDKVYCLSGAKIQHNSRRPTEPVLFEINTKNCIEILLDSQSNLVEVVDSCLAAGIPKQRYDFVAIDQFKYMKTERPVDLIGIVLNVSETSTTGVKFNMVTIVDSSRNTIVIKTRLDSPDLINLNGRVILAKGINNSRFDGESILADTIEIDPDFIGTERLKKWHRSWTDKDGFQFTRHLISSDCLNSYECLANLTDLNLINERYHYKCKATVIETLGGPIYRSCPSPWCWKKVEETEIEGEFCCRKCYKIYLKHTYRYKLNFIISDFSATGRIILWNKAALPLLGLSPEELVILMNSDKENYRKLMSKSLLKTYVFTLTTSKKIYNEKEYINLEVENIEPVYPVSFGQQLVLKIKSMISTSTY